MRALALLILLTPAVAGAANEGMRAKAERARRDAEATLGRHRKERVEDRSAITARLQGSYARLAEVRRRVEKTEAEVARQRADLERSEREVEVLHRETERLLRSLLVGARATADAGDDLDSFQSAVRAAIDERLDRFQRAVSLRVADAELMDRSGRPVRAPVVHVGDVMRLAAGDGEEAQGLLRQAPDGAWLVDGIRFSEEESRLLLAAAKNNRWTLPLDVDGSLASRANGTGEERSWLASGGPFVWPILFVGVLGLVLLCERLSYFGMRHADPALLGRVVSALSTGKLESARALLSPERSDLDRVLLAGVETFSASRERRDAALEAALLAEEPRLERSLTLLAAAAGVAPLLGLLGTVTGMITTFEVITEHGTGNPRLLSGGISIALITTQLGLLVAVPLLLGHAFISRLVERRQALLEECRTAVLGLGPEVHAKPRGEA